MKRSQARLSGRRCWAMALLWLIAAVAIPTTAFAQTQWKLEPLGPQVHYPPLKPPPVRQRLETTLQQAPVEGPSVALVEDGRAAAVLVVGNRATPATRQAAETLQGYLEQMSGAKLPILAERLLETRKIGGRLVARSDGQRIRNVVLLGDSDLAASYGHQGDAMPLEGYRLQTKQNVLLVVGNDRRRQKSHGTRHAVMALLERHLGIRWLWPGELGTVVPKAKTIRIQPLDEQDAPAMNYRWLRSADRSNATLAQRHDMGLERLKLSPEDFDRMHQQSPQWWDHQRLDRCLKIHYGHAYDDYWERFGESHPEWFALQPDGTRDQDPFRERLCVTNEELVEQIASDKIKELSEDPSLDAASVSPNDGSAANTFCMCPTCRQLDPVHAPEVDFIYDFDGTRHQPKYVSLTDRYLTFYSKIAERVAKEHPDRLLGAYAYDAYRAAPVYAEAHPNLLIGFVGLNYFDKAQLTHDRTAWDRWARSASNLFFRPNLLLEGHGYPAVYVGQLGRDIRHFYQTGMIGADFDAVVHHWSTQGLNYYVLAKLLWDPSQDVGEIIRDYCRKGFGPAAPHVWHYFHQLDQLTRRIAQRRGELQEDSNRAERDWLPIDGSIEASFYTEEVVEALRQTLETARSAATDDATIQRRIDFLEAGVDYADIQARLHQAVATEDTAAIAVALQQRDQAFQKIFREHPLAVNVAYIIYREGPYFYRRFGDQP